MNNLAGSGAFEEKNDSFCSRFSSHVWQEALLQKRNAEEDCLKCHILVNLS